MSPKANVRAVRPCVVVCFCYGRTENSSVGLVGVHNHKIPAVRGIRRFADCRKVVGQKDWAGIWLSVQGPNHKSALKRVKHHLHVVNEGKCPVSAVEEEAGEVRVEQWRPEVSLGANVQCAVHIHHDVPCMPQQGTACFTFPQNRPYGVQVCRLHCKATASLCKTDRGNTGKRCPGAAADALSKALAYRSHAW